MQRETGYFYFNYFYCFALISFVISVLCLFEFFTKALQRFIPFFIFFKQPLQLLIFFLFLLEEKLRTLFSNMKALHLVIFFQKKLKDLLISVMQRTVIQ